MALMENKKQIIVIIAAVATGLVASILVSNFVQNSINEQTQRVAMKFKKDQDARDQEHNQQMQGLHQKMIEVEARAQQAAQQAAMAAAEQMRRAQPLAAEAKKEKKFVSLALRMPPGKRALTLQIESLGAVGGLLSPGDYVDIIAQMNVPISTDKKDKDKKESVTAMIFQNIQVLAVNANIDEPAAYEAQQNVGALKLTFAVTPEEASLLSFAQKNGKLELALRSPNEKKPAMISAATWVTLAEYVLQNTGVDLGLEAPEEEQKVATVVVEDKTKVRIKGDPFDPAIDIYKGGRGMN